VLEGKGPSVLLLSGETTKDEFQRDVWQLAIQNNNRGVWKKVCSNKLSPLFNECPSPQANNY